MKQLDRQKARIIGVSAAGKFDVIFYKDAQRLNANGWDLVYTLTEEEFQFLEDVLKEQEEQHKEFVNEMDRANLGF